MFSSVLNTASETLTITNALLCTSTSILLGFVIALVYMAQGKYSKNFVTTLVILPPLVQIVIMMTSGNLGSSVAVLGAFSLVRFRSQPGSSKEITSIFFAMAVGLATGMGYLSFAALITIVIGFLLLLLYKTSFGNKRAEEKELKVTIPENLDYTEIFDDIFEKYTKKASLERVRTTNLGSMFELSYAITLKDEKEQKTFLDDIRCKNGNLTVMMGRPEVGVGEL